MLIFSFLIPIVFTVLLGGMFIYKAGSSTSIFLLEYADLFFPIVTWNFLILNSLTQNISCLVEVYGLSAVIILCSFLKYKFPILNYKYTMVGTVVLNTLPFLVRF